MYEELRVMKTFRIFASILMACSLGHAASGPVTKPFKPRIQLGGDLHVDKMREQNLNVVKKAVEGIGETLPQKIDPYTTMVRIESNGTKLIYTLEVDAGPKSDEALRSEGEKRIAPVVKRGICKSAERFLKAGIDIAYRYLNKATGNEILRVEVTEKDCPGGKR
jgi:hypothetical protein